MRTCSVTSPSSWMGPGPGRASTSLVERIHVDYYGTQTPLNQLAGISVPEPHQIVIQPWDRGVLGAIEKAILKSDIGLMPNVDGTVVRLNIPPLTEERRRDLVKLVHRRMEDARVEIRNHRREAADTIKARDGDGGTAGGRAGAPPTPPRHVAIIMDGNRRWARSRGLPETEGHAAGVEAIRPILRRAVERDVEGLSLYPFSRENWSR